MFRLPLCGWLLRQPLPLQICKPSFGLPGALLIFLSLDFPAGIKYTVLGSKPDASDQRINPRQPQGGAVFYAAPERFFDLPDALLIFCPIDTPAAMTYTVLG